MNDLGISNSTQWQQGVVSDAMATSDRFKHIDTKPLLIAALIKAQTEMKPALKEALNPHFNRKYVDLAGAWAACGKALTDNGLTVVQTTEVRGDVTFLVTTLYHVSGASIDGRYPLLPAKQNDPQALGGALTYARRYALMAIVGLAPEDDDGNAASERAPAPAPKASVVPAKSAGAPTTGTPAPSYSDLATATQVKALQTALSKLLPKLVGADAERAQRLQWISGMLERPVASSKEIGATELSLLIKAATNGEMPKVKT